MATKMTLVKTAIDEMRYANIIHQRRAEAGDPEYISGKTPSQQPKLSRIEKNVKIVTLGQHVSTNSTVIRVFVQNDGSRSSANSHKSTGKEWILMKISNIVAISLSSQRTWNPRQLPPNWRGRSDKHINVSLSVADNPNVDESAVLQSNRWKEETRKNNAFMKARRKDKGFKKSVMDKLLSQYRAEREK